MTDFDSIGNSSGSELTDWENEANVSCNDIDMQTECSPIAEEIKKTISDLLAENQPEEKMIEIIKPLVYGLKIDDLQGVCHFALENNLENIFLFLNEYLENSPEEIYEKNEETEKLLKLLDAWGILKFEKKIDADLAKEINSLIALDPHFFKNCLEGISQGILPLHMLCEPQHFQILEWFLKNNIGGKLLGDWAPDPAQCLYAIRDAENTIVYLPDEQWNTPLHIAAGLGDLNLVKLLHGLGASLVVQNQLGETPFDIAVQQRRASVMAYLLQVIPDPKTLTGVETVDVKIALEAPHQDVLKLLCTHRLYGFNFSMTDQNGIPLVHIAAAERDLAALEYLSNLGFDLHVQDVRGITAWDMLVNTHELHAPLIHFFLKVGVDIDKPDQDGKTLLHAAVQAGNLHVIQLLLEAGANPYIKDNKEGITPWDMVTMAHAKLRAIQLFVQIGCDINQKNDPGKTPLHIAAEAGNIRAMAILLQAGADPNIRMGHQQERDTAWDILVTKKCLHEKLILLFLEKGALINHQNADGKTILHAAAETGNLSMIAQLLEQHADPLIRDKSHKTPWDMLAHSEFYIDEKTIALFVKAGVDLNEQDADGSTLLHAAAKYGFYRMVSLMQAGANSHIKDHQGRTPWDILLAKGHMHEKAIRLFLEQGAPVNDKNAEGKTLLHIAAEAQAVSIIKLLLQKNADPNMGIGENGPTAWDIFVKNGLMDRDAIDLFLQKSVPVNKQYTYKRTILHKAVAAGNAGVIESLLEGGADPHIPDQDGFTPSECVMHIQYITEKALFLFVKAGVDLNKQDASGKTALNIAMEAKNKDKMVTLLKLGADPNIKNQDGITAWNIFVNRPCMDENLIGVFLKANVDVNQQDADGRTLLYAAMQASERAIVKQLLAAGADLHLPNKEGSTPWDIVPIKDVGKYIIQDLIEAGVDINREQPVHGRTILHAAIESNEIELVETLLRRGADPNIPNKDGLTAWDMIVASNLWQVPVLLSLCFKKGVPVNKQNGDGKTVLHVATAERKTEFMKMLLKAGASPNIPIQDAAAQSTAWDMFLAFPCMDEALIHLFVKAGVNINKQDKHGTTLLHAATKEGQTSIMKMLLEVAGANPNIQNNEKNTPWDLLLIEFPYVKKTIIDLFVKKGVDINQRDPAGNTLLHKALQKEAFSVIKILLESGANPDIANADGMTVWDCMVQKYLPELQMNFSQEHADFDKQDRDGNTLFHKIAEKGLIHCMQVLLLMGVKNQPNGVGITPLYIVCNYHIPNEIINFPAGCLDINSQDGSGETLLFKIVDKQNVSYKTQLIELFLLAGAKNIPDETGKTPFDIISERNDFDFSEILLQGFLKAGADPLSESATKILQKAADKKEFDSVKLLLQAGVQPYMQNEPITNPALFAASQFFLHDPNQLLTIFRFFDKVFSCIIIDGKLKNTARNYKFKTHVPGILKALLVYLLEYKPHFYVCSRTLFQDHFKGMVKFRVDENDSIVWNVDEIIMPFWKKHKNQNEIKQMGALMFWLMLAAGDIYEDHFFSLMLHVFRDSPDEIAFNENTDFSQFVTGHKWRVGRIADFGTQAILSGKTVDMEKCEKCLVEIKKIKSEIPKAYDLVYDVQKFFQHLQLIWEGDNKDFEAYFRNRKEEVCAFTKACIPHVVEKLQQQDPATMALLGCTSDGDDTYTATLFEAFEIVPSVPESKPTHDVKEFDEHASVSTPVGSKIPSCSPWFDTQRKRGRSPDDEKKIQSPSKIRNSK